MSDERTIQLILVVETSEKSKTDELYIKEILRRFYSIGENKISFVYMDGKRKYKTKRVIKEISEKIKKYELNPNSASYVIYVLDKDDNVSSYSDASFVKEVESYCKANNYRLIWFVREIEEVMWGEKIEGNKKSEAAKRFIGRGNYINEVSEKNLLAKDNVNQNGKSNILTILNKFPEIKKK